MRSRWFHHCLLDVLCGSSDVPSLLVPYAIFGPKSFAVGREQVIVFDPQYDSYACMCRRAGGEVKLVKLDDSDWSVPREEFRAAFGPRTKMVLVNTPHNPTGACPLPSTVLVSCARRAGKRR